MAENPCTTGSRPKPGHESDAVWLGTSVGELISLFNPWLGAFITIASPLVVDTQNLCEEGPPPFPTWTPSDVVALSRGGSIALLQQTALHYAWYFSCECISAPTPTPVVQPAPPGLPDLIPSHTVPCLTATGQLSPMTQAVQTLIPSVTPTVGGDRLALPFGATSVRLSAQIDALGTDTTHARNFTSLQVGPGGPGAGLPPLTITPPALSGQITYQLAAGMEGIQIEHSVTTHISDVAAGNSVSAQIEVFCGVPPGAAQPECCPPDPGLIGILLDLQAQVALLVGQSGPSGPLTELSATPITGEGIESLRVGARQVLIELSTLGPSVSFVLYANPDRAMRAGTIRWGNDFGWRRRDHVDSTRCLFPVQADSTVVSWSLSPGTSGTLRQLGKLP